MKLIHIKKAIWVGTDPDNLFFPIYYKVTSFSGGFTARQTMINEANPEVRQCASSHMRSPDNGHPQLL